MPSSTVSREDWRSAAEIVAAAALADSVTGFVHATLRALEELFAADQVHFYLQAPDAFVGDPLRGTELTFSGATNHAIQWTLHVRRVNRDFGPREHELGEFLRAKLGRITLPHEEPVSLARALERVLRNQDEAYAVLDPSFEVLEVTGDAGGWLANLQSDSNDLATLKAALRETLQAPTDRTGSPSVQLLRHPAFGQGIVFQLPQGLLLLLPSAAPTAVVPLTRREREILHWLQEGKTDATIAALLRISPRTVERHCASIYVKLGVHDRLAAAKTGAQLSFPPRGSGSSSPRARRSARTPQASAASPERDTPDAQ